MRSTLSDIDNKAFSVQVQLTLDLSNRTKLGNNRGLTKFPDTFPSTPTLIQAINDPFHNNCILAPNELGKVYTFRQ